MAYEFIGKVLPTDWGSAALVVVFYIIFEKTKLKIGSPWTRLLVSIFAAIAIKGFLIYINVI